MGVRGRSSKRTSAVKKKLCLMDWIEASYCGVVGFWGRVRQQLKTLPEDAIVDNLRSSRVLGQKLRVREQVAGAGRNEAPA